MEESTGAIESSIDPLPADPRQTCWLCANKWREHRKNSLHSSLSLYLAIFLCLEKTWGQNYAVWCVSPSYFAFRPFTSTRVGRNSDLKHRLPYIHFMSVNRIELNWPRPTGCWSGVWVWMTARGDKTKYLYHSIKNLSNRDLYCYLLKIIYLSICLFIYICYFLSVW